ncbi:hypothetical protein ACPB9E_12245 [Streptomyces exfoliatus]|uniref:hypothetical protein n=1 Tax=Streptomyces exfoliatus TaxID=1905 RepID=UPI003C2D2150
MLLSPEKTLFVRGVTPVLLLSDAPVHGLLPVLAASDGDVPLCGGWSILPRLTMCVVDGPGEAGVVVPALVAPVVDTVDGALGPGGMGEWCADVERAGGAVVLSVGELPEVLDWAHLIGSGVARGGFVACPV